MDQKEKDNATKILKKSHEITPISEPLASAYTKAEVIKLIEQDREKVEVSYADFLRKIS